VKLTDYLLRSHIDYTTAHLPPPKKGGAGSIICSTLLIVVCLAILAAVAR
jgi:hypothetical protein